MSHQDDKTKELERLREIEEHLADILDGTASAALYDAVAESDEARDLRHDAQRAAELVAGAGGDFQASPDFGDRVFAKLLAARPDLKAPSDDVAAVLAPLPDATSAGAAPAGPPTPQVQTPQVQTPQVQTPQVQTPQVQTPQVQTPVPQTPVTTSALAQSVHAQSERAHSELAQSGPSTARVASEGSAEIVDSGQRTLLSGAIEADASTATSAAALPNGFATAPTTLAPVASARAAEAEVERAPATDPLPLVAASGSVDAITQKPLSDEPAMSRGAEGSGAADARWDEPARDAAPMATPRAHEPTIDLVDKKLGGQPAPATKSNVVPLWRKKGGLLAVGGGLVAAAAAAAAVVMWYPSASDEESELADKAVWTGEVTAVSRASADKDGGLEVCDASGTCASADQGATIAGGATLRTDARTRARVKLADGSWIALDRSSELTLPDGEARVAKLSEGVVVADVARVEGADPARFVLPQGEVEVLGTKLAITTTRDRLAVEVARGEVRLHPESGDAVEIRAGEEATIIGSGAPVVASTTSLADMLEWSDVSADEVDAPLLRGIGELKAKKPGETKEREGAVRLTKHSVKVRVVDVMARTTIDETFTNQTDEELEGIFRFPLPPGAQIERLALEVDGELIDGAFVDRDRGAAIWRGVIQNAAPTAPRPREEIVWVPGPWRDPALLEWQRGGRFELRIFPIPKKSSRRVVLTYTQVVDQAAGIRRFSYPLVHDPSGRTVIDEFDLDVQVLGHDPSVGVVARGYDLTDAGGASAATGQRLTMNAKQFVPAGDLTVEYALENRDKELTAWAYKMPAFAKTQALAPTGAAKPTATPAAGASAADARQAARDLIEDDSAYVAISLRPKLPRWESGRERLHVIVVDSSRSMFGERYARASRLASSIVREMDRRDTFMVLACDTTCQGMGADASSRLLPSAQPASASAAGDVDRFLGRIEPDGGSDLRAVVEAARAAAGSAPGRDLRILYLGDGTPSVGPTQPAHLEAAVRQALPDGTASVVAVALGSDADTTSLQAMARGGGGVVVPYVPGQRVNAAALDVLSAAYGVVLRDAVVELPPGLEQVAPARLDPIPAGGERFVVARMRGDRVDGTVRLRGRVSGESFEQTYPAAIVATENPGNAFVTRLFAAQKISDLELVGETQRAKVVELSKRFAVASRFTSLIVLESEAMFDAFGLDRGAVAPVFTGEIGATSESADAEGEAPADDELAAAFGGDGAEEKAEGAKDNSGSLGLSGSGKGGGGFHPNKLGTGSSGGFAPPPAPKPGSVAGPTATSAPMQDAPAAEPSAPSKKSKTPDFFDDRDRLEAQRERRPNMVPMRKVFDRKAQFLATGVLAEQNLGKLAAAEAELAQAPDSRDRTVALYRLLSTTNRLGEAAELTARWAARDALDPDALLARADLAARQGDRDRAIRILGGLADVRPGDRAAQERLASVHEAAGNRALACEHRITLGDLAPGDAKLVANAVRCSREQGMIELASLIQSDAPEAVRKQVDQLLLQTPPDPSSPVLSGDVRVTASWTGGEDVDIALIDDKGQRVSWLGSFGTIRVSAKDAQSTSSETLSLAGMPSGNFTLEITRARPTGAAGASTGLPISGSVTLQLVGETRTVPFTLTDSRVELGTVRVFFTSRLVPIDVGFGGMGWR